MVYLIISSTTNCPCHGTSIEAKTASKEMSEKDKLSK